MSKHTHNFVNNYDEENIVFGLDRETDEKSLIAYLQKFAMMISAEYWIISLEF